MKKIYLFLVIALLSVGLVACKAETHSNVSITKNSAVDKVKLSELNKVLKESDDLTKAGKLGTAYGKVNSLTVEYSEGYF